MDNVELKTHACNTKICKYAVTEGQGMQIPVGRSEGTCSSFAIKHMSASVGKDLARWDKRVHDAINNI